MLLSWETLILLATITILIYLYSTRNFNYWKDRGVPFRTPTPFFGNLIHLVMECETPAKSMAKFYDSFEGPYFGFFALNTPQLVLKDPQLIKDVLIKDFHQFQNRAIYCNEKIDPILSNSLLAIKQPQWKPLRAKLSPIFTSGKIKTMFYLMNDCGKNLKSYIDTIVGRDDMEIKEITAKYTTDVIATCAFGIDANSFDSENSEFRIAGRQIFDRTQLGVLQAICYFFAHIFVKLFRFTFINRRAAQFLHGVFMDTIRQRETLKNKRNDLVDVLIDLKNQERNDDEFKFYGDRLVAQAVIFFAAGHETTSSTISFTLHELCVNVGIQDRLRKEILDVIEKHGELTYETVQDMKYLDMVVSETLRKYPLTTVILRQCGSNYTISETGLTLENGMTVLIPQHGLHWDPKYFPNPEKFDPERFSEENKHKIPSYVYLPFGDGPRNCIGERFGLLSVKLGIMHVIRNFTVEKNLLTKEPIEYERSSLLRAKNGIRLTFQPLR